MISIRNKCFQELPMKRKIVMNIAWGAFILLFAASCAGSPKPVEPAPVEPTVQAPVETPPPAETKPVETADPSKTPPDQAATDALNAAMARAEKSRKQAFDIQSPAYAPSEWKAAEALFLQARDAAANKNMAAYAEAVKLYDQAAAGYDAAAEKSLPQFAEARRNEIEKARSAALTAGVEDLSPERLAVADKAAADAQGKYDAGDYYGAAESASEARARYLVLKTGSDSYAVKSEIDRRDFAVYDPGNYTLAGNKLDKALSDYDEGKLDAAGDATDESLLRYNLALGKGREMNASGRGKNAAVERQAAQDLKANVGVKSGFEDAASVFAEADAAFKAERFDESAELYAEAESLFSIVRATAAEKRQRAEDALLRAQQKMSESEKTAKEADTVLQGGTR